MTQDSELKPRPGHWPSPISANMVASAATSLSEPRLDGDTSYWLERRPQEQGRSVLMRCAAGSKPERVTGAVVNVRSRANEYGGGSWAVRDGVVWYCDNDDQRIWQLNPGESPRPVTPAGPDGNTDCWRYADLLADPKHQRLIAVFEDHSGPGKEPVHSLIAIDLQDPAHGQTTLAKGADFYASPALSNDSKQLTWLSWNHPDLPWDHTRLWLANLDENGQPDHPQLIAGEQAESVFQPGFLPDGQLVFVSDRNNWWNLYRFSEGHTHALTDTDAEFGLPQWVFGMRTWAVSMDAAGNPGIVACYTRDGLWQATRVCLNTGELSHLRLPFTQYNGIAANRDQVLTIAASAARPWQCNRYSLANDEHRAVNTVAPLPVAAEWISEPRSLDYPSEECRDSHALYYPPCNPEVKTDENPPPPLLVKTHGGPTAATGSALDLGIQYWTSRGFAVLDVNYGGSTGYGREYRRRLYGQWGEVDVDDCVNGALWLVQQGLAKREQLAIRGSSAGGYTTLAALTFRNVFKAGASYYGIGDLEALIRDTHKFEARYLDQLIGPWPQREALYRQRSPIHAVERLNTPVIFFQGLKDAVVPPQQAEAMVAALQARALPVEYLSFADEGHGFRRAETIVQCLEAELAFYQRVFA